MNRKPGTDQFSTRHCVYIVIGTDGSLISEPLYWRTHAVERCPRGCHVRRYWLHLDRAPGEWLTMRKRKKARR